jgi:hypothetical protein
LGLGLGILFLPDLRYVFDEEIYFKYLF